MKIIHEKLDRLDQAIIDRASVSDLRGHIIDIRDHLASHLLQSGDLQTKLEILQSELREAATREKDLNVQLQTVKQALEQATAPKNNKHERPEIEERILHFVSTTRGCTREQVAAHLGVGLELAIHHICELIEVEFIFVNDNAKLSLHRGGQRYLAERGFLK